MIVLVDGVTHSKHVQVIRCDIKPESVEKSRGVENEPISGKNLGPTFQTPLWFFENDKDTVKTQFVSIINWTYSRVPNCIFFYILFNSKY
jgi:hypothetical protein